LSHQWNFVRAGGFDQVELSTGADLAALGELDQKLWVALACPINGLVFDERTLVLVDLDKDGRIRAGELLNAAKWVTSVVSDVEVLAQGSRTLALSALNGTDEGKLLRDTARAILASLGKKDAKEISVDDMKEAIVSFAKERFNGDGVVPLSSAEDEAEKKAIADVLACTAAPPADKNGQPGVDELTLKAFFEAIDAYSAWLEKAESDEALRPLGLGTAAGYDAFVAVKAKIDDYFARVRVASYDARALAAVNRAETEYLAIAAKDFDVTATEVAHFPLSTVAVDRPLALDKGLNPAWVDRMTAFRTQVMEPLAGAKSALTVAEWASIVAKLAPYTAHVADKKGALVEKLGAARVKEIRLSNVREKLAALVLEDKKAEPLAKAIESVERLVRYNRDLLDLANNFVSFRDFYSRKKPATFQIGTLYLDTRACDLVVRVNDAAKHAAMAPLANTYLLYCDCKNSKGETMQIAAAMTAGDVDNLMVGRNGVFYDRKGVDWDATVVKIVDNPISVRQAFWSPYKKAIRMVEEYIAKRAADSQAAADARVTTGVDHVTTASTTGAREVEKKPVKPIDIGIVAALGVAVGGITAAFGAFLSSMFGLGMWMPLGVIGLVLAISGPSMAVAWLKLRKRNLGPILDANGWAVNAMARVNVPLGGSLTRLAALPPGSKRELADPFAEKRRPWKFYIAVIVVLGLALSYYMGWVDEYLPESAKSTSVLGEYSPRVAPPDDAGAAPPTEATPP
jgi:hypothetical protein